MTLSNRLSFGWFCALLLLGLLAFLPGVLAAVDPEPELDELIGTLDPTTPDGGVDPGTSTGGTGGSGGPRTRNSPEGGGSGGGGPTGPIPGQAHIQLLRNTFADYWDNISALAGQDRQGPRTISNDVLEQTSFPLPGKNASDLVWQWGQFLDHDLDLTEPDSGLNEQENIEVPLGDPFFDPEGTGTVTIPFVRSVFDPATGTDPSNPREQVNDISAFIDAGNVYGTEPNRIAALRSDDSNVTGRLRTSQGDFLPYNTFGLPNAGGTGSNLFLAGDIRANETVPLSAMHTLWVREHNTVADRIRAKYPYISGDQIYRMAQRVVISEIQTITYQEFLPLLLGTKAFPRYSGFDPTVDPGIANEFSTAGYRLGHTMLSPIILRLDANGNPIPAGPLPLREAFFSPPTLVNEGGLEPIMKGLATGVMQRIDNMIVDDVRNFLFGPPGAGGLDLGSLNIQRGRDHGLPDYNTVRIYYGLAPKNDYWQINSTDPGVATRLAQAYDGYGGVGNIDLWVGALAEEQSNRNILMGELLYTILQEQFQRLRDGDEFWYQNIYSTSSQRALEKQTLAKVIARNTVLDRKDLQANVFIAP